MALRSPLSGRQEAFPVIRALTLILALAAPAVVAQDAPRFFIEKIEVRNVKRVSSDVVIAESRLREGVEYSEAELRDAAARLTRLPFLLGAEFTLEKGTERGRHVLVMTIQETRSFFYLFDVTPSFAGRQALRINPSTRIAEDDTTGALGFRWFVGRRGAVHVGIIGRDDSEYTTGYSAFAVGYTQYDVFGTRGFATLNIKQNPNGSRIAPQVVAGIPLSLNQTVTAEYDQDVTESSVHFGPGRERIERVRTQRLARVTWSYNTTNHPFVPTEGTLLTAGPFATWTDNLGLTIVYDSSGPVAVSTTPVHARAIGVESSAVRYWPLTDRTSVSAGGELGLASLEVRTGAPHLRDDSATGAFASMQGGISHSLWSVERRAMGGDSRIELIARARVSGQEFEDEFRTIENRQYVQITGSWVRHSSWGTLRLGVGYAW